MYVNYNAIVTEKKGIYYIGIPNITDYEDGTYNLEVTYGETLDEALENGKEILTLYFEDYLVNKKDFPEKINADRIIKDLKENQYLVSLYVDLEYELSKVKQTFRKKTLTIPTWLDIKAQRKNINFSQLLQKALKEELNL